MGSMFRSEPMVLCQIFIQPEAAYSTVSEMGEVGCVQFRDLNDGVSLFQRKFVSEIRRCDELERKIHYITNELKKEDMILPEINNNINMPVSSALNPKEMINLEAHLEMTESEMLELTENEDKLKSNYNELNELRQVLENTEDFFSDEEVLNIDSNRMGSKDQLVNKGERGELAFVAGIIKHKRIFGFEQMLWRISHGNVFLRQAELTKTTAGQCQKLVFVAFFQGEELKSRIKKVCQGFRATMYPCPSSHVERDEMIADVRSRLEDLKMILNQTNDQRRRVLANVSKNLPTWSIMKCMIGECWVPTTDLTIVQGTLARGSSAVGNSITSFLNVINTNEPPPTYNRTNKFTQGFQNLIDAYGIASYREINPALYAIITFPFLFAVMFGDVGHGLIMLTFGAWMCIFEQKLSNIRGAGEIWSIFFGGRYIILLMGLFSIYTGAIYNDVFSKSMNLFGSAWRVNFNSSTVLGNEFLQLDPKNSTEGVYSMGIDPVWQLAGNKIIFQNSHKMKLSIIFGVTHMLFGLSLSVVNHVHFRRWGAILMEFIPQVLFLVLLFGYMVFMMFFKWVKYNARTEVLADTPGCAPSVLIMFIDMMLFKSTPPLDGCKQHMFDGQKLMQLSFVAVGLLCIPWMLFTKPLFIYIRRKKNNQLNGLNGNEDGNGDPTDEPMSEIFIQQAIHTIEYVLSTISHTASYLRLWALSLAHSQLSEVLWEKVLSTGLAIPSIYIGPIILYMNFISWVFFTIAILVLMEGLSAFLHTLRLHWVEFMSKHYEGEGHAFVPFSFKTLLEEKEF
ncbi:V-type proton ATPase 116 kDa subunit a 1-like isoform X2 [Eupeodes corollae]|uniref:V-type proton ATPase 116 kDa subunit a 1-like isoform X2 n=1 Tax=Eupeodes corollae TaxID=290404 RepID=UPI00248FB0F6|nr:V-type proton ATPase 116 kDa subunit a 1-like isoform X2 [Eupeodes corollae]